MVELHTLGRLELFVDGAEIPTAASKPKNLALLAYLAAAPPIGFHRRDTLIALLWPEADTPHARAALRQALYELRRALGRDIIVGRGVEFVGMAEDGFNCDVRRFWDHLAKDRKKEALGLIKGEFLEGFHVHNCQGLETWIDDVRSSLWKAAIDAAWNLSDEARAVGDVAESEEWGLRTLNFARYDEGNFRRYLRLLHATGNRSKAVHAYAQFCDRLRDDLELGPAPETVDLIKAIRARPTRRWAEVPQSEARREFLQGFPALSPDEPVDVRSEWRRPVALAGLVLAALVAVAVGADSWRQWSGSTAFPEDLDPSRVLMIAFESESGDPEYDAVGRMATDWITRGLAQTGLIEVAEIGNVAESSGRAGWLSLGNNRGDSPGKIARDAGFGTVVTGSFRARDDSAFFSAQVIDSRDERVIWATTSTSSIRDPIGAIDELKQEVVGGVASIVDPALAAWTEHAPRPPAYEAYLEFMDGLDAWRAEGDLERALGHFERAMALDADFVQPQLYAVALLSCPTCVYSVARADSLAQRLHSKRQRLGAFDRTVLDALRAWLRGETLTALEQWRRVLQTAPNTEWQATAGMVAQAANRPAEAIDILTKVDPEAGWLSSWPSYWRYLTEAHHMLGHHQEELEAARRGKARQPGSNWMLWYQARALAALGQTEQLRRLVNTDLPRAEGVRPSPGYIIADIGTELRSHGHAGADEFFEEATQWFLDRREDTRRWRVLHVQTLSAAGRWAEARPLLEGLLSEQPDFWPMRGGVGLAAARTGDRPTALGVIDELEDLDPPYAYGLDEFWRARILAALGDLDGAVEQWRRAVEEGFRLWPALHISCEELCDYPPYRELMLEPRG